MNARSFIDTNIFVYSIDRSVHEKSARAAQLVEDLLASEAGVVSYQVVQEFLNVALRRFRHVLAPSEAHHYLDAVFRPMLVVNQPIALCEEALLIHERYRLGWYDSLIVAAAVASNCRNLYTEDLQHGMRIGDLRISNPLL